MLTPQFLKQLHAFSIRTGRPFRGKFRGERRSLNRGLGVEFADYRVYELGDDLRHVDWNVYARLGKLFIKLFQADEELPISFLIDTSLSMGFGKGATKLMCAKQIVAALGYIALLHSDSVAVYTFADRLVAKVPRTYGAPQFSRLTKGLGPIEAAGQTRITGCLRQFSMYQRRPGQVVLLSDFLDIGGYARGLKLLAGRGFSLSAIHIMSPDGTGLPPRGDWQLEDTETGETKAITVNEETLMQYRQQRETFCDSLRDLCTTLGINYAMLYSDTPVEAFILEGLHKAGFISRRR